MNSSVKNLIMFVAGSAIGTATTYIFVKKKYEKMYKQIANEEIEEMRAFYKEKCSEIDNLVAIKEKLVEVVGDHDEVVKAQQTTIDKEKPSITEYADMIKNLGYARASSRPEESLEKEVDEDSPAEPDEWEETNTCYRKPYIVTPDDFGEKEGFDIISLYLYHDNIVADDTDNIIEEVDDLLGWNNLKQMGKFEDDVIHIRNEELEIDYEVLRSDRNYNKDDKYYGDDE